MSENLATETKLADRLAITPRLLGGGGGSELDVFDAESIESLGDGDLSLSIEESIGKLLSLCDQNMKR